MLFRSINEVVPNQRKEKFIKFIMENYKTASIVFLIMQMIAIFLKSLPFAASLILLNLIGFIIAQDIVEEKHKKMGFRIFKVSFIIFIQSIILIPILKSNGMIGDKSLMPLGLLASCGVGIGVFSLLMSENTKVKLQKFYDS